jgi:hypothetical protein
MILVLPDSFTSAQPKRMGVSSHNLSGTVGIEAGVPYSSSLKNPEG